MVLPFCASASFCVFCLIRIVSRLYYICITAGRGVHTLAHFNAVYVQFIVRTRVMCQAGRASGAAFDPHEISAWLCERAPLWVVVHVCALLREY